MGLDIFKKDNFLRTAEYYAIQYEYIEIFDLLQIWTLPKKIEEAEAKLKADKAKLEADKTRLETLKRKYPDSG